ncbi:uncharacterized protein LOC126655984 [Mercurialis annua]|uniref:uncharacterized protein LOC126655984 n=1 Tax=Mercurialis annua TaxID=3986 RepID=UPI00215E51D6|nr:uncharacterized protein LOC126655984 [Mercurialis annua]
MERSEPTLVPEWLRSSGSVPGGGSSAHHFASSSSHSDVSSSAHHTRSRNTKSTSDFDSPRLSYLDRTSSSNSRKNSSNGSAKHAYSNFSRSHRDKDRERDKDRLSFGNHWDHDASDPLGSILSRNEKDTLRRSNSMVSRKPGEVLPRRFVSDLKNGSSSNHVNGNGLVSGGSVGSSIPKAVFEKDFPSLGSEERQGVPEIGRVSSPGLSTAVQSLPVSGSALIGGEGWTSALAEVPAIIGNSSSGSLSSSQTVTTSVSVTSSSVAGLNMAEALTQAPSRTRIAPQLSVQTQRLEELAIKQSRQLIPVTPSMPKSLALNASDKAKPKTVARSGEMNMASKILQQQSSLHSANHSALGGHVKSDGPKASHGKLFVLKPGWENGVSPSPKDAASPTNNASRVANSQLAAPSAPSRSPNNPKSSLGDRKSASSNLISGFNVEKRPSLSQTQSRHDFFNLLKKKTSTNSSATFADSTSVVSSTVSEKSCEANKEAASSPPPSQGVKNGALTNNGGMYEEVSPEEVAFLRSLGWEENSGEDEFLTEEEINAFLSKVSETNMPLKVCRGVQQKMLESRATGLVGASSELNSSDSESGM